MSAETRIDLAAAQSRLQGVDRLPWDAVSTRELAEILQVSVQVLANWRVRGKGPRALPHGHYRGNKTFYRIFEVQSWLSSESGCPRQGWEVIADWLRQQFCRLPESAADQEAVWRMAEAVDALNAWPKRFHPTRPLPIRPLNDVVSVAA